MYMIYLFRLLAFLLQVILLLRFSAVEHTWHLLTKGFRK